MDAWIPPASIPVSGVLRKDLPFDTPAPGKCGTVSDGCFYTGAVRYYSPPWQNDVGNRRTLEEGDKGFWNCGLERGNLVCRQLSSRDEAFRINDATQGASLPVGSGGRCYQTQQFRDFTQPFNYSWCEALPGLFRETQ
jgi:hypothetical protein